MKIGDIVITTTAKEIDEIKESQQVTENLNDDSREDDNLLDAIDQCSFSLNGVEHIFYAGILIGAELYRRRMTEKYSVAPS